MSLLFSRPLVATAILVAGILSFEGWSWELGRAHLAGISLPPAGGTLDVEIDLPFTPEAFNIERLQQAGRLVRIDGRHAWLKAVPEGELVALARLYWIRRISPWKSE
jgi:hypothetical protein